MVDDAKRKERGFLCKKNKVDNKVKNNKNTCANVITL
tara:strand:- start:119 stop:229 length:111 start_codon:yes stop_codon:yes gene_type:complete